jgi:hypothetical protein
MATDTKVSFKRIIKVLAIIMGSFFVLGWSALLILSCLPAMRAIAWHLRNGNTVVVEGHTFHAPLLYEVNWDAPKTTVDIVRYPGLIEGASLVYIVAKGKIFEIADALKWQAQLTGIINSRAKPADRFYPATIHGKQLTFICVHNDVAGFGESFMCHAVGTNLSVSTTASYKYRDEARAIFETSR